MAVVRGAAPSAPPPRAPAGATEISAWAGHVGADNVVAELFRADACETLLVHVLRAGRAFRGATSSPAAATAAAAAVTARDGDEYGVIKRPRVEEITRWGYEAASRGASGASRALQLLRAGGGRAARSTARIAVREGARVPTAVHAALREQRATDTGARLEVVHAWGVELGAGTCFVTVADIELYEVPAAEFFDALFARVEQGRAKERGVKSEVARLEVEVEELAAAEEVLNGRLPDLQRGKVQALAEALNEFKRVCRTGARGAV